MRTKGHRPAGSWEVSLARARPGSEATPKPRPSQGAGFHKGCVGSKTTPACQVPSRHCCLPLQAPLEPPTPTRQIWGAGRRGRIYLTPSLIAASHCFMPQKVHTKLLRALVSDRGGPNSRLNIPKGTEGTGLPGGI